MIMRTLVFSVFVFVVGFASAQESWTFEGDTWEVYTQSNAWQLESVGAWRPLGNTAVAHNGAMRVCDNMTPMMAVWNAKAGEGHVFYVISDAAWFVRATRVPAKDGQPAGIRIEAGAEAGEKAEVLTHVFTNRLDFDCHKLHALWNRRCPARRAELPAIYNTWLCRFDKLNYDFLLKQVVRAKEIGFDYFVVDAGWFGPKASWTNVRGDWEESKDGWLGGRLGDVSKAVSDAGMKFGFWVEAECASPNAKVVKEHPDWFIKVGNQYFLDFTKSVAFDGLLETVCALVKRYEASYLKFDFNQTANAKADPAGKAWGGYNAAYRRFVEAVRARNPGIYIEGCASGGFMMDLGWSRTFDGFWLTDDQSVYDGIRIAKETMFRLPPRYIERWLTLSRLKGLQPDYNGRDSRLLTTEDATWTNVRSVDPSRIDAFVAGGPFCMSCDLTTFDAEDVRHFRRLIAETKADSAFWTTAVGRVLVDDDDMTVFQYSDEKLTDVRLVAIGHKTLPTSATLVPVVDPVLSYLRDGKSLSGAELAKKGFPLRVPANGAAVQARFVANEIK